ncbi:molecular chaperone GrpE [Sphingobium fontiphilum]|uniref:Protein GrpE n=1 Tax=Sphingobium fontiphilum TaxID=944425 RepID=A0A7W6DGW7_9SPHN|nr:nucleotide exchange factor GrpE [Sphingobium fontiphilum]MBB3983065.1 molecular chaperone GrpE [Sphingobium fontiphilum]
MSDEKQTMDNQEAVDTLPEDMSAQEAMDAVDDRIAALENDLAAAKQDVLYAHAETQNVRRRMEKELADARAYAATSFARDMLSVADNLARALQAIPAELRDDEKMKGLVVGLEATGRELEAVFSRNGITKLVSVGEPLDPNRHQAMMEIPSADMEPGTVLTEMQAGYLIKDRLLRPALVGVAKKPD